MAARAVLTDCSVSFEAHNWLDNLTSLWRGVPKVTTAAAKKLLSRTGTQLYKQEATARACRWHDCHAEIATALDELSWAEILKLPGSTAAQRLLLHRIKSDRLSGWDHANECVGCPHCTTDIATGGQLVHIFWD